MKPKMVGSEKQIILETEKLKGWAWNIAFLD